MNNTRLIDTFYKHWINKDIKGLSNIYDQTVIFNDPAFKNLDYKNTLKMWNMLFTRNKAKKINDEYEIVSINDNLVIVINIIKYTMNDNPVVNKITSVFEIENNKIVKHTDTFNFKVWLNQVKGIKKDKSKFYYWLMQKMVRSIVKKNLKKAKEV